MHAVPEIMGPGNRVAGFLIEKDLKFLGEALANPKKPFVAILGGAKVSDKIGVIESLIQKADEIVIGGAMAVSSLSVTLIARYGAADRNEMWESEAEQRAAMSPEV